MDPTAADPERRQSGLWKQNPSTGYYEKQPQPSTSTSSTKGPYTYYQPPPRTSANPTTTDRRSFAERTGPLDSDIINDEGDDFVGDSTNGSTSDPFTTAAANAAATLSNRRIRDEALSTHEKILQSPEHLDVVRKISEAEGARDQGSAHFATKSHFSSVAPAVVGGAEMSAGNTNLLRSTGPADLAKVKHVNEAQPALRIDPNATAVPENLRTKPWSPVISPTSAQAQQAGQTKSRQTSSASASATAAALEGGKRRSSVPERSPLQRSTLR